MMQIGDLLRLADEFQRAVPIEDKTLSFRVFGDSKKLAALRDKSDITVSRFNGALGWFATNWPADAPWPEDIERPASEAVQP